MGRGKQQVWDPETSKWPKSGFTVDQLWKRTQRNKDKPVEVPDFVREVWESPDVPDVSVHWLEDFGRNKVYDNFDRVRGTEALCRAEAARLGLNTVVIRAGLHNSRNQHAANGSRITKYDPRSGKMVNDTVEADWHITVYMGYDLENLIVHGHIYVTWDAKATFGMRIVKDPSTERKHLIPNEDPVASIYWPL